MYRLRKAAAVIVERENKKPKLGISCGAFISAIIEFAVKIMNGLEMALIMLLQVIATSHISFFELLCRL